LNPGLLVEGDVTLTGPAGEIRIRGEGASLVLDAGRVRWAPALSECFGRRGRAGLGAVARALESHRLRVDVERAGRVLFSMGSGCRGGLLSWLFGGAPVARRALS